MSHSVLTRYGYCFIAIGAVILSGKPANSQSASAQPSSSTARVAGKLVPSQLEKLLAPIALYPDVLISQILPASTFPIEVVQAARWLKKNPDPAKVGEQGWAPSVSALCRYSDIVSKMNEDLDWTQALGVAFTVQPEDVMDAIQRLRRRAEAAGNLTTTEQHTIVIESGLIRVMPTQANLVYVPRYDPVVVYVHDDHDDTAVAAAIGFSAGLALGVWLDTDCDWHHGHVYHCAPGYWGGGGWHHAGRLRFDNSGFVAGVGPHRAFVAGKHGGAYVGPRGGAVWGQNGRGAAWTRSRPYGAPAYTGRYATQGNHSRRNMQVNRYSNRSNNNITVNRNTIGIDRGDRTNVNRRSGTARRDTSSVRRGAGDRPGTKRAAPSTQNRRNSGRGASSSQDRSSRNKRSGASSRRQSSSQRSSFGDHRSGRQVDRHRSRGRSSRSAGTSRGGARKRSGGGRRR